MRSTPGPKSSIARYSRSRYSKSSTIFCKIPRGWLMFAGMLTRLRSFPIACFRMPHRLNVWFTGAGAGSRARGVHPSDPSSDPDPPSEASEDDPDPLPRMPSSSETVSSDRRRRWREGLLDSNFFEGGDDDEPPAG